MTLPILSILTFLPLLGAAFIFFTRGIEEDVKHNARHTALLFSTAVFALSIYMFMHFDPTTADFQFIEERRWIPGFDIMFRVGVDGISVLFVLLAAFLTPICILASWKSIETRVKEYMMAFLVLESLMIGMFVALDMVLFYIFFEAVLLPMFLIIGVWGGPRRVYASFKFFLYTLLGSVLMLVAMLVLYNDAGTTNIIDLLTG